MKVQIGAEEGDEDIAAAEVDHEAEDCRVGAEMARRLRERSNLRQSRSD